jgi:HTH-type transcriptional regulator/antitoxin MqsA
MIPKFCAECGAKKFTKFKNESVPLHNGTLVEGLSGWRCSACGEIDLDDASHLRFVEVGTAAVLAEREETQKLLIRVRKKLKLTQHQASELTGGGHNAFGRYERGEARPMPAVVNLFRLLDKHPGLLKEIR